MARFLPLAGCVLTLVIVSTGCADSGDDPTPFDATAGDETVEPPTAEEIAAAESAPDAEDEFDLLEGPDVELVETPATSIEEWEQLEEIAGDEYDSLFPEPSSGDVQPQGFINNIGKVFKGVHYSASSRSQVPANFLKVGTFLPKTGPFKGSLFVDVPLLSEALKKSLYEITNKLAAGVQMQGSVKEVAKLPNASADQVSRLTKLYGAGTYKVATPAPLMLADGTVSSSRFFIKMKNGAKPQVVEMTNVVTGGGKKKVLQVPPAKR